MQYFTGMIIMLFAFTIRLRDNNLKPKNTWLLHDTGKHDQDDWFVCFVIVTAVIAWETPGPIPNPEAKAHCADGTALVRVWESRSPPDLT